MSIEWIRKETNAGAICVGYQKELLAEIERLQEERKTLPRFADDRIAYPGMDGWFPGIAEPGTVNETASVCGNDEWGATTEECFSTQTAAKAAGDE